MPTPWPVLVLDNDPDTVEALTDILSAAGFSPRGFSSPRAALDALRGGYRPAVVLLDHHMREMSGISFRREMLVVPDLARIPAILFSGDRIGDDEAASVSMSLIRKPAAAKVLLTAVGGVVGRRKKPR